MKKLIAALETLRARILVIVAELEAGDQVAAREQIDQAEREWREATRDIAA